jgi:GTP cyclohydrolase I
VAARGIGDTESYTITTEFLGQFQSDPTIRADFLRACT